MQKQVPLVTIPRLCHHLPGVGQVLAIQVDATATHAGLDHVLTIVGEIPAHVQVYVPVRHYDPAGVVQVAKDGGRASVRLELPLMDVQLPEDERTRPHADYDRIGLRLCRHDQRIAADPMFGRKFGLADLGQMDDGRVAGFGNGPAPGHAGSAGLVQ